jgi:glycyl-tRNA synthetase beta chain
MVAFLLEVGTEELPASFVRSAIAQWQADIPASLMAASLMAETVQVFGTPRRLAVLIDGLPDRQPDRTEDVKGPPVQMAFIDGKPSPAAQGFARKQGVNSDDLVVRETDKGSFVFAMRHISGQPTPEILQDLAPQWIVGLKGERLMRWGSGELKFPRPIRWLVSLWGDRVLPLVLEGLVADRITQGHRVLHPDPIAISEATTYVKSLQVGCVLPNRQQRMETIRQQVAQAATSVKGEAEIPADLLEEVTDLVEWPTAVVGAFEAEFLDLPVPVIKSVMVTHQRYFAVHPIKETDSLLPYFVTVANGDPAQAEAIAAGNGRVIRARLADGRFFYTEDRKQPLYALVPKLAKVTFEASLGSMLDKVERIQAISSWIADQLGLKDIEKAAIQTVAHLCKADLVTQMVYEFPEMQGIMGRDYALQAGESPEVADGIEQHYWPLGAGDRLPNTLTGQVVGIADRIDSLVGLFSLGKIPSGSSDRFALRRAANSIVQVLWKTQLPLDLLELLDWATRTFETAGENSPVGPSPTLVNLEDFFLQRVQTLLQEERQIDYDLVNAVVGLDSEDLKRRTLQNLNSTLQRATYLQQLRHDGTLAELYPSVNRTARLAVNSELPFDVVVPEEAVNPQWLQEPEEKALFAASQTLYAQGQVAQTAADFVPLVAALLEVAAPVNVFFDAILVMDENPDIRRNRLNLLAVLRNNARLLADFGAVVAD